MWPYIARYAVSSRRNEMQAEALAKVGRAGYCNVILFFHRGEL